MLELNNYYIQNNENLRDFFIIIYTILDDVYLKVTPKHIQNRRNVGESNLSDSEIITIATVGEAFGATSEKSWFNFIKREYKDLFPEIGDRTRFNRTKINLHDTILEIQKEMLYVMGYEKDNLRIIDSMPIPVCKFGRAHFSKSFKGIATYGYCASKKETFFGMKLHVICTQQGFISDFVLTAANVDDRDALWDLTARYINISIIGDKGYINKSLAPELKKEKLIDLIFMKRDNDKK
ncbi:IS982 family transposase [Romboutsia maritimum]|uniref:IS982 family transposase n=1 Tax=Romboutsia maritimum TaxID=2020948 RepID=A0A255ID83_9FIRM|nr:IS982 family transposase [Romboutsia maritimum]RDY22492.1 IS982 family transposase [Romboutsia maritimum]